MPKSSPQSSTWYLYIIRCADNSLYTGITTDLDRRFTEHQSQGKKCAKYLRGKSPLQLVFSTPAGDKPIASRLELRLKKCDKKTKEKIITGEKLIAELLDNGVGQLVTLATSTQESDDRR
jgi:putative endonuclease